MQDDWPLRPQLDLQQLKDDPASFDLIRAVSRLLHLRTDLPALRRGDFRELFVSPRRIGFSRRTPDQWIVVTVSAEKKAVEQEVKLPEPVNGVLVDLLNPGQNFEVTNGRARLSPLWPCWARVMEVRSV